MASSRYLNCKLELTASDQAQLSVEGRQFQGSPDLDGLSHRLLEADDPKKYGTLLFEALLPPSGELRRGYYYALSRAEDRRERLRLRLAISPRAPELHAFYWEYLYDSDRDTALACSPDTAFSRYLSLPTPSPPAIRNKPRLLIVLSSPTNLGDYGLAEVDPDELRRSIESKLRSLRDLFDLEIFSDAATPGRIRRKLETGRFHAVHLQCHGRLPEGGPAGLALEREDRRLDFIKEAELSQIFEGNRDLRLVVLMACHSGTRSRRSNPFSGLGPRLVRRNIPAVLAMQERISMDAAAVFIRHFYANLAVSGLIDAAVNEARHQLSLDRATSDWDWGIPALFMRLPDGRIADPRPPTSRDRRRSTSDRTSDAGNHAAGRPVPDLLPYMPDRSDQRHELYDAFRRQCQNPNRPLVGLVLGDELQAQEMFLRRLKEVDLPKLLDLPTDRGVTSYSLGCPEKFGGRRKHQKKLLRTLAERMGSHPLASRDDLHQSLAQIPSPVLVHAHMWLEDCGRHAPALAGGFLDFWRDWLDLPPGQFLLALLFVKYRNRPTRFWEKRRLLRIHQIFESYESNHSGRVHCMTLPELEGVRQMEVEDWARTDAAQFCSVHDLVAEIRSLFRRQQQAAIPMERLAIALAGILGKLNPT